MGNSSFCQPFQNIQNQNRTNLPRKQRKSIASVQLSLRKQPQPEKIIKTIDHNLYQIIYPDGTLYRGMMKDEKKHGKGKICHSDGTCYEGSWVEDEASGEGVLTTHRFTFQGQFHKNQPIKGKSIIYKKRFREEFEGELKDFYYHGKGKLVVKDYAVYQGQFENGMKNGIGSLIFDTGSKYEGQFMLDCMNGKGRLETQQFIYEGEFKNNKFQGFGECHWKNGSSYVGHYIKGKREGAGTFVSEEGKRLTCEWRKDKPIQLKQIGSSTDIDNNSNKKFLRN